MKLKQLKKYALIAEIIGGLAVVVTLSTEGDTDNFITLQPSLNQ